jgi:polysaccharide deacetylase 2 family uncharacterized protein YibQ
MEGFSEPAGGPGPHTLTTAASAADNFDSLYWLMGRFSGYIAVSNYLGGKFTADQRAHRSGPRRDLGARPRLSR